MREKFAHPVERIAITGRFISGKHGGIDYGWEKGHQTDTNILAANDGVVVECEFGTYIGNYIVLKHGEKNGKEIYTRYGHLRSFSVKKGDTVNLGQTIGIMGETGEDCYGVHLHFDYVPCNKGEGFVLNRRIDPAPHLYVYQDQRYINEQDGVKLQFSGIKMSDAQSNNILNNECNCTSYIVKKGDTMWKIAKMHNLELAELTSVNPQIENPDIIHTGDIINIPKSNSLKNKTYTVQKGDSFWAIAEKHGVDYNKLLEANPQVENKNLIYEGQIINIP